MSQMEDASALPVNSRSNWNHLEFVPHAKKSLEQALIASAASSATPILQLVCWIRKKNLWTLLPRLLLRPQGLFDDVCRTAYFSRIQKNFQQPKTSHQSSLILSKSSNLKNSPLRPLKQRLLSTIIVAMFSVTFRLANKTKTLPLLSGEYKWYWSEQMPPPKRFLMTLVFYTLMNVAYRRSSMGMHLVGSSL